MDTSTLGQELGIEPPTFWFVDNLHVSLSHWLNNHTKTQLKRCSQSGFNWTLERF